MKCPVCLEVNLAMMDRQGIEVDYCPQCRGVWLDRGELDKIIERSTGMPSVPGSAPQRRDSESHSYSEGHGGSDYNRNHDRKTKKKGGLMGELFDF